MCCHKRSALSLLMSKHIIDDSTHFSILKCVVIQLKKSS